MSQSPDDAEFEGETSQDPTWPEPTLDIVLRTPVEFKDETYDRLSLREPTMGEWEDIFAHPTQTRRRYAVSLVAGIPMAAVKMMGIGDVVRAEDYLNSFFEVGRAIGGR